MARPPKKSFGELIRYGIIGLTSNGLIYLLYILLTSWGAPSKFAMTLLYCSGTLATFWANRNWTFRSESNTGALTRYLSAYLFGYLINLTLLFTMVDLAKINHRIAQAISIVLVAACLFTLMKIWVFPKSSEQDIRIP
jgi:putative flippase GtrA